MDIETLNLLVTNYGIISTCKMPTVSTSCDNPTTGDVVKLKYCGADVQLHCGNNTPFHLPHLEKHD